MNGEYIRKTQIANLKDQIIGHLNTYVIPAQAGIYKNGSPIKPGMTFDANLIEKTIPLIQSRIKTFSEYWPMCEFFFKAPASYEQDTNKGWMTKVIEIIKATEQFNHETLYNELSKLADELEISKSKLFMDIRIAVTGKKVGPPLFESMEILGKEESLQRLMNV